MEHVWYKSGDGHSCTDRGECLLCSLSVCKACGLYEGSLTTDCPGESVPYDVSEKVYKEKLDYRENEGWVNKFSPHKYSCLRTKVLAFQRGTSEFKTEAELMIAFGATKDEFKEVKKEIVSYLVGNK